MLINLYYFVLFQNVTISFVLPSVVMLKKHLASTSIIRLRVMCKELMGSIDRRFGGLLKLMDPDHYCTEVKYF